MMYLLRSFTRKGTILKIGYASDGNRRFAQYQSHNPGIEFISSREGDILMETAFHVYLRFLGFSACKNEWYIDCPEVLTEFHTDFRKVKKTIWKHRSEIFPDCWWQNCYCWRDTYELVMPEGYNPSLLSKNPIDVQYARYVLDKNSIASPANNPELDNVISKFNMLDGFDIRLKYLTELDKEILRKILEYLPENYQNYISFVGLDKYTSLNCSGKLIEQEMNNINKMNQISQIIIKKFSVGSKYLVSDIKKRLIEIYNKFDYPSTPTAAKLSDYFETKECLMKADGKSSRQKALEILKRKS